MSRILSFCLVLISIQASFAQESAVQISKSYFIPTDQSFEDYELYGIALASSESQEFGDETVSRLSKQSFSLDENRSIDLLIEAAHRTQDSQLKSKNYFLIADRFFERSDYESARQYYEKINSFEIDFDNRSKLQFRLGYCYLLNKNFSVADKYFKPVSDSNSELSHDARYYEGICAFYLGERERAISCFESVSSHGRYKKMAPFYLAQIYFKDGDYDNAIAQASRNSTYDDGSYLSERIMGLSYMALGTYEKAAIHLENYNSNTSTVSENDLFQLASVHYRLGNYEKSKEYFKELSHQQSQIGQMSNFLLASSCIKTDDKKAAQAAFKQASKLEYFPDIQEESEFLYYKISSELGEERIAISGLASINENHSYHSAAQPLLADLLVNSEDRLNSLRVIENQPYKSKELLASYQKLSYREGMQKMKDESYLEAATRFKNALEIQAKEISNLELNFRLGQTYYKAGQYLDAKDYLRTYIDTPGVGMQFEANYMLAYIAMDSKDYEQAILYLENAIENFNPDSDSKDLFDDSVVRLADLELVKNNYSAALEYYELAIANNAGDSDYILYQKSMIYGVNKQIIEKLTSLEKLLKKYPESSYRDDALYQLAETLVQLGKNNQAYQVYNSIITEYGNTSDYTSISYMRQGLISYNQGDLYAALDSYKQGIKLSTDKEERRRALKAVEDIYLYEMNDPDSFFTYKESLTGLSVDDISRDSIVYNTAYSVYRNGEYERAIQQFESYLDKYKTGFYREDAHYYSAESYLVLDLQNKALENYIAVIDSDDSRYRQDALKKASLLAYNENKDYNLSFRLFDQLIKSSQEVKLGYIEAALYSAYKSGKSEAVIEYGSMLVKQNEATAESKSQAHFYMAKSYYTLGDKTLAIENYEKVLGLTQNNRASESCFRIAQIQVSENDLDSAESRLFDCAEKYSSYPYWVSKSILLLGDVYVAKKDYLNATAAYESIIENFKDDQNVLKEANEKLEALNRKIKEESRISDEESFEFMNSNTNSGQN